MIHLRPLPLPPPLLLGALLLVLHGCGDGDAPKDDGSSAKDGGGEDTGMGILFDGGSGADQDGGATSSSSGADGGGDSSGAGLDGGTSGGNSSGGSDAGSAEPGEFGWPCTEASECDSAICIPSPDGHICTKKCTETCPIGYRCVTHQVGADTFNICAHAFPNLCDPCQTNADCNSFGSTDNVCVSFGPDGSFCGAACGPGKGLCPGGYTCQDFIDPDSGKSTKQCMIGKGQQCSCSKAAQALERSTPCVAKNLHGSCEGVRKCTAAGLSECLAPIPGPEECDGKDNDCNGKTDDIDFTATCTGKKNEFGECVGTYKACVNGKPVCDAPMAEPEVCDGKDNDCNGKTDEHLCNDGNPCTVGKCNSDGSCKTTPYDGLPCDDGLKCSVKDVCKGGKCVMADGLSCDDSNECTVDLCSDTKGCYHENRSGPCKDDGKACTQDLCEQGVCKHDPTADGGACLDDGNGCTADVCKGGACTHDPLAYTVVCKEDGNSCTADICEKGSCAHKLLGADHDCLDDGDPCTQDKCIAGACSHPPAEQGKGCLDDGEICTNDVCVQGQCAHPSITGKGCAEDGDPCTIDACGQGKCRHKPASGPPCADDGRACTEDKCQAGKCKHLYNNAKCDDGDPCTTIDSCNLGKCKGYNMLNCNDHETCTYDKCNPGQGCVHTAANGYCSDGNACTVSDACINGRCVGKLKDGKCNDHNPCTMDTCKNNSCQHVNTQDPCPSDGNACTRDVCQGGICAHKAEAKGKACGGDNNPCTDGRCDGKGSCGQVDNGKVCDDGDACTSNDKCQAGKCVGQSFKSCGDGNPCTKDYCNSKGHCRHDPLSHGSCVAGSGECRLGICAGGQCISKPGVKCQAKYKADLCSSVYVPGSCSSSGKCVVDKAPPGFTCPGCKGLCFKCTIFGGLSFQYCLEF